jgi:hypothetical protein
MIEVELNPVLEYKMAQIFNLQKIKDCYELRVKLLRSDLQNKNEFERNEIDIKEIEAQSAILKIDEKTRELNKELKEAWTIYEFAQTN